MNARRRIGTTVGALALAASILGAGAGSAAAQTATHHANSAAPYRFQSITSPHDPTFTQLLGINDFGTTAGYDGSGQTMNGVLHPNKGFTLALASTPTPENYPRSAQTQVIGINDEGETDGFYVDRANVTHGFVNVGGTFTTVDLPGTTFNQLLGLNNGGQVVGYVQDARGQNHAYIRDAHGNFIMPPIPNSQATGVNDQGVALVVVSLLSALPTMALASAKPAVTRDVPAASFGGLGGLALSSVSPGAPASGAHHVPLALL